MGIGKLIILLIAFILIIVFIHRDYFSNGRVISGQNWEAKQCGNTYVVKLKNHSEIVDAFSDFVKENKITAGTISGLGAVSSATLRAFNPSTKQYEDKTFDEQMEISNLVGNISTKDGKPYLHLHITLGTMNYNAYAGHLLSATINGAGEFVVVKIPHAKIERTADSETGLNIYKFRN